MDGTASELACVHDEVVFSSVLFCFEAEQASITHVDETGL